MIVDLLTVAQQHHQHDTRHTPEVTMTNYNMSMNDSRNTVHMV